MFCLNCDCVLCTHSHRYIGNIVISKIVISGFCPIQFTVTFAIFIVIPGISLYRGSLYGGSTVLRTLIDVPRVFVVTRVD